MTDAIREAALKSAEEATSSLNECYKIPAEEIAVITEVYFSTAMKCYERGLVRKRNKDEIFSLLQLAFKEAGLNPDNWEAVDSYGESVRWTGMMLMIQRSIRLMMEADGWDFKFDEDGNITRVKKDC